MSRSPSPHVVLALQAGLVSQELLDAVTAVDDKLCSACLFAEYWDTHSDRDAWLQQHLSSQLHSLAVPLHQWCCEQSASWARGAVHIPVFSSPAFVPAYSAFLVHNHRRDWELLLIGTDSNNPLLYFPMDHCYLKQHGSKKNTNWF